MARKRIVRVLKVVKVDDQEAPHEEAGDFWDFVLDQLAGRAPDAFYDHWHNGHTYRGLSFPELPLLYMAKNRNKADLPSVWTGGGGAAPLSQEIHEPLFLCPIKGTTAVATLGTSGAASPTAVGRWLTSFVKDPEHMSFELHPVIMGDGRALMESALGATTLEVGVRADEYERESTGHVERALEAAAEGSGKLGTARVRISLGPGNHGEGDPKILQQGASLFGNPAVTSGKLGLRIPNEDGSLRSQILDLVNHRFTHQVEMGGSDESLSIETAMPALMSGIGEFRKTSEYRALRREATVD